MMIEDVQMARSQSSDPEVSIVIPCLNEADTLATCVSKALETMVDHQIDGEVIVADNGSTDNSQVIAISAGARLVRVAERGYGSALMSGIAAARGALIIMGDADDSYDFREIPSFLDKLREGFDLVLGCRLPSGGGIIIAGAMPPLHRLIGNPLFSILARKWFRVPLHDVHCGLRGFRKDFYCSLNQRCEGMEFATEMVIKASLHGGRITEIPITLHPDGRKAHAAHLRTFRDGWRHLRFYLMCSPRWLFLIPGTMLILAGIVGYGVGLPQATFHGVTFDVHTLLFASLAIVCGYQSVLFALFTKTFAIREGVLPNDPRVDRFLELMSLERGLLLALLLLMVGFVLLGAAINDWRITQFGPLNYQDTMRKVIPGSMLTALGFQTMLASFFAGILGFQRQ